MSIRVMERVWRYGPPHPNERLVLLCLADKAADDGRNAFPSMATIAERTALSQRTVERVIDRLVAAGYLVRERRYMANGRRNRSNLYTIVLGRLEPNTVTVTVLNDANTVTMTPSNTVTMTPSNTVTVTGSDTVTVTPYPSHSDPSHSDPSHSDPAAAAAPAAVVPSPAAAAASDMQLLLRRHGIDWNKQTRQLERCPWVDNDYIAAHVAAAEARGEGRGLVIRRMLGHESPPAVKGAPAAATATAWDSWQAWLARHGDNGAAAVAELDAPTRRMLDEFGRDYMETLDAGDFKTQHELAAARARRPVPAEYDGVVQR